MSNSTAGTGNGSSLVHSAWTPPPKDHGKPVTDGLFRVEVCELNRFRLVPLTALARSLAAIWMHGDVKRILSGYYEPGPDGLRHGRGVSDLEFAFEVGPMLSQTADVYASGMGITAEDYAACRALIEERRAARAKAATRTTKRPAKKGRSR